MTGFGYDHAIFMSYLAAVPMLHACNDDERQEIAERAEPRQIADGAAIVTEGETGDEFFVLASGHATVTRGGKDVAKQCSDAGLELVADVADHLDGLTSGVGDVPVLEALAGADRT